MDNPENGGNSSVFAERQGRDDAFLSEKTESGRSEKETNRALGSAASSGIVEEIFGGDNADEYVVDGGEMSDGNDKSSMGDVRSAEEELLKAVEPGSEHEVVKRELGKIGVALAGEKLDVEGVSAIKKKIEALPLYEQSAARDAASAEVIYANFNRVIGNDDAAEAREREAA